MNKQLKIFICLPSELGYYKSGQWYFTDEQLKKLKCTNRLTVHDDIGSNDTFKIWDGHIFKNSVSQRPNHKTGEIERKTQEEIDQEIDESIHEYSRLKFLKIKHLNMTDDEQCQARLLINQTTLEKTGYLMNSINDPVELENQINKLKKDEIKQMKWLKKN